MSRISKEQSMPNHFDFLFTAGNVVFSFILTFIMLFASAWLFCALALPEEITAPSVKIITYICIATGGFRAARHMKNQGLLNGGICGLLYVILLYLAGSAVKGSFAADLTTVIEALLCAAFGAIGGILGVNCKNSVKRKR